MRVCVTGIAGFLGSHIAQRHLDWGDEVVGVDNLSGGSLANIGVYDPRSGLPDPKKAEFHLVSCQHADPGIFRGVQRLYHCAALAHEGLSIYSPRQITESIYGASVAVFTCALQEWVEEIVFCSSMARYGAIAPPFRETQVCHPQDPYGIAKVAAEQTLACLSDVHGIRYTILVPHNIIGPNQRYYDPYRNVAAIMVNRMLLGKQPIIYGDGLQKRVFSDVRDVTHCFTDHFHHGEIINVGPDEEGITVLELAHRIARLLDFPIEAIFAPARANEVKIAICSSDKARKLLNYQTKYSLDETLESLIEYVKRQGPKEFVYSRSVEIMDGAPRIWTERLM